MAFTEDLSVFFDTKTGFADDAVINLSPTGTRRVKVIFNTPTQSVQIFDSSIEADAPNLQVETSDLTGVRKGRETITVRGRTYSIEKIADDGTGLSTLYLK